MSNANALDRYGCRVRIRVPGEDKYAFADLSISELTHTLRARLKDASRDGAIPGGSHVLDTRVVFYKSIAEQLGSIGCRLQVAADVRSQDVRDAIRSLGSEDLTSLMVLAGSKSRAQKAAKSRGLSIAPSFDDAGCPTYDPYCLNDPYTLATIYSFADTNWDDWNSYYSGWGSGGSDPGSGGGGGGCVSNDCLSTGDGNGYQDPGGGTQPPSQPSSCPSSNPACMQPLTLQDRARLDSAAQKIRTDTGLPDTMRTNCRQGAAKVAEILNQGQMYRGNTGIADAVDSTGAPIDTHSGEWDGPNNRGHIDGDWLDHAALGDLATILLHEAFHALGASHPGETQEPYTAWPFNQVRGCIAP